jgi:hypothetical protein
MLDAFGSNPEPDEQALTLPLQTQAEEVLSPGQSRLDALRARQARFATSAAGRYWAHLSTADS